LRLSIRSVSIGPWQIPELPPRLDRGGDARSGSGGSTPSWHFDNRQALLDEALDSWEKSGTEDVIGTVDSGFDEPRAKLRCLFELAPSAKDLFAAELAICDWAHRETARSPPACAESTAGAWPTAPGAATEFEGSGLGPALASTFGGSQALLARSA
jgi:hypothetical protein